MYICKNCGKKFETKQSYAGHMSRYSRTKKQKPKIKEHFCKFCYKEFETGPKLGSHVRMCKLRPDYESLLKKSTSKRIGIKLSEEHKNIISESMKKAHKEGRAWNIGMSRWNNKSSYPEKFFMKVIKNEFDDKNYQREYNVGIYSLDFAWVDKKKVIEIDGAQHQRFEEYKERDKRKDQFLIKEGWKILRIPWKNMYHHPQKEIQRCKNFIS